MLLAIITKMLLSYKERFTQHDNVPRKVASLYFEGGAYSQQKNYLNDDFIISQAAH